MGIHPETRGGATRMEKNVATKRANILTGDVSLHMLRHTALSRMIASGIDDFT